MKSLKIGALNLNLENIELDFGLTIKTFSVQAQKGSAQLDPFELSLPQPGTLTATVTAESVQTLLATKAPKNISGFKVQIVDNQILIDASANIIVNIPVKAICGLHIIDGKRLEVTLEGVDMMGGKATNIIQSQIEKINPIFEASELPIDVELTSVELEDNLITLHGIVKG